MNKKIECEIAKDLAIPFSENLINSGSEEFIKEHLSICKNCKKYYENIKLPLSIENATESNKDNIMINQFKKVHNHINILKIIIIVIFILIIITFSIYYMKNNKLINIINISYNKIEYMKELNNYKLTVKTIQNNLKTNDYKEYEQNYYYKDGKYKFESNDSIKFYEDNSYDSIYVYNDLKLIQHNKQDFIETIKGTTFDTFSDIINYKKIISPATYILNFSLREERFNGIDCYVIRVGTKNNYRDVWIDKNNSITIRVVNEVYQDFYREEIYTFYENIVIDKDVDPNIINLDKYKDYDRKTVNINSTEEIKLYYELYNK